MGVSSPLPLLGLDKDRQLVTRHIFKDDGSLDPENLGASCEPGHGELFQVIGVANGYVDQKVVGTGHMVESHDLR